MNHWTLRSTFVIVLASLPILSTAAQQDLVCSNSKTVDKEIVLNELITTGNGNYKYTEVKVIKNGVDISQFELCLGSLPFKEQNGAPTFGCVDLGIGKGIWYEDATTTALLDNNGPNSTAITTYYNPTWITYQNSDILAQGEGQMDSADGQIILREKANPKNVVDYLCYSNSDICKDGISPYYKSPTRLADTSINPNDPDSVCWNEFKVGLNSTKVFGRSDPDGTGAFVDMPDGEPTTGNSNDGPPPVEDQVAAVCSAIDNGTFVPVYSKSMLTLSNATVRITNKSGTQNNFSTTGNYSNGASITAQAQYRYGKYLPPQTIPAYSAPANNVNNDIALSNASTLAQGSYRNVNLAVGTTATLTGGTNPIYKLTSLTLGADSQLNIGPGTYHVGQLILADRATINITSGPVKLIIGNNLALQAYAQLMDSTIDPGNLTIYLSSGTLVTAEQSKITGTIVTASGTTATFTNKSSLHGSIFGLGTVAFSDTVNAVDINYSTKAIKAQRALYDCPAPPSGTTITITPSTPTSAITCQPQPVTLNVTKADGTPYVGTLKLTTSTIKGNWQPSANLIDATPNDGIATVSFVATDFGKKDLQLSHTLSGTVSVTATDTVTSTITATSVPITFSDAGLLWLDSAGAVIAPVSNPLVLVAGTPQPVQLRAVKQGTTPGVCTGVFANGEKPPLLIGSTCVDPASCAVGQQLQGVGVNNVSFVIGNPQNTLSTTNEITFGANSTATISLMSPDVGKMDLSATFAGNATSPALLGATSGGAIISKPATLKITNVRTAASTPVTNPAASTAAGSVFARAGERFFADVTSYNSLGIVTPSFGRESTTPQPSLAAAAVAPMGGIAGLITKTGSWVKGAVGSGSVVFDTTAGLTYSEVGAISLAPGLLDYLGAGAVPTTTTTTIGRFIPDRLEVSASAGVLSTTCPVIYRGQPLAYSTSPTLTVTAVNKAGNVTRNYDDGFFKLPATMPVGAYTLNQTTSGSLWGLPLTTMAAWAPVSGNTGAATLQFNNFLLSRVGDPTSSDAPIDDGITVQLPDTGNSIIKDTDGVCVINIVTGLCSSIAWELPSTNLQWLYGRISMTNNNGAETEALNMPVTAEYWDGLNWQTNLLENGTCTALLNSDFSPGQWTAATGTPDTSVTNWTGFGLGTGSYDLTAPGAGNTGKITMTGNVPSWLKAWDGTAFTLDPSATAVFGIYRGRPPILFRTR